MHYQFNIIQQAMTVFFFFPSNYAAVMRLFRRGLLLSLIPTTNPLPFALPLPTPYTPQPHSATAPLYVLFPIPPLLANINTHGILEKKFR